eukprot:gnl/TRDRNA2_/TRDRNA2_79634_c0_seq1.p2 gnl/TRDRNA2_/TRDRNA2_79634_c0~~gnl/TRDRNA2_/TRDRNA2_79634_c0_seq1.p2  ORF type:complete len:137 (-),score=11.32 gnl/TRDRNA2_/TRDRNA2_79634_c0_seq1:130-540(-)
MQFNPLALLHHHKVPKRAAAVKIVKLHNVGVSVQNIARPVLNQDPGRDDHRPELRVAVVPVLRCIRRNFANPTVLHPLFETRFVVRCQLGGYLQQIKLRRHPDHLPPGKISLQFMPADAGSLEIQFGFQFVPGRGG